MVPSHLHPSAFSSSRLGSQPGSGTISVQGRREPFLSEISNLDLTQGYM